MLPFDAVVLAGGAARRMSGVDKTAERVGGAALLDRVLSAVAHAERRIVVGPQRPVATDVTWVREEPPGGGPAAGVVAGLAHVTAPFTAVLAGDLPFVTRDVVDALRDAAASSEGALLVDDEGQEQLLLGCWSTAALLSAAAAGPAAGSSVRRLLAELPRVHVRADDAGPPPWWDCDTPDELSRAREWS